MKKNLKIFFLILIIIITIITFAPSNIFANGEDTYDHQIALGNAGEDTTISFWGTGYLGYYKFVTLYNNNSTDQIDYSLTIDKDNPWDLEMTNALPAGNYHYNLVISGDYDIMNGEIVAYPEILLSERHDFTIGNKQPGAIAPKQPDILAPSIWVRTNDMTCWQVYINEDNNFELIFWWLYGSNNWVKIYDMDDNLVFEKDLKYGEPVLEVDLPDGFYTVRTYHTSEEPLQEFLIGKP